MVARDLLARVSSFPSPAVPAAAAAVVGAIFAELVLLLLAVPEVPVPLDALSSA